MYLSSVPTTVLTLVVIMKLQLHGTSNFPEHLYTASHLNLATTVK